MGHEAWVLTRASRRPEIEAELRKNPYPQNLKFVYYDLPRRARWWKSKNRGLRLYYLLWQWKAFRLAERLHREQRFERVHHITFGSIRQPSFMGNLGIPFTFGPLGGGETAPWRLRLGYPWSGLVLDALRDLMNGLIALDPLMRAAFRQAESVYVTTRQGIRLVPRGQRHKVAVQLAVGSEAEAAPAHRVGTPATGPRSGLRVLFVGRLVYWKGMHLGFRSFARFAERHPDARLTVVGSGPQEGTWRRSVEGLGIEDKVEWISWIDRDRVMKLYRDHDLFLFPSLHDSGGAVVLEALEACLPVVCLDLGGPGSIVDDTCGLVIATGGRSESEVVEALAAAMAELRTDDRLHSRLSEGGPRRAAALGWGEQVRQLYSQASSPPISATVQR